MAAVRRTTSGRSPGARAGADAGGRVVVENAMHPGTDRSADAVKHRAMRRALLKVLPARPPGLTLDEARAAVLPHLPPAVFPGGARAGWWFKTVQLDLEAKGEIARERTSPLRVHRVRRTGTPPRS